MKFGVICSRLSALDSACANDNYNEQYIFKIVIAKQTKMNANSDDSMDSALSFDESEEDIYDSEHLKQFKIEESDVSSCAGCCIMIFCWPLWILALLLLMALIAQHFQFAVIVGGVLGCYVVGLVVSVVIAVVSRVPDEVVDRRATAAEHEFSIRERDERSCKKFSVYVAGYRRTKSDVSSVDPRYHVVQLDTRRRALLHIGLVPNQRVATPEGIVIVAGVGPVRLKEKNGKTRASATYGTTLYIIRNTDAFEYGNNVVEETKVDVTKPETMAALGWKVIDNNNNDNNNNNSNDHRHPDHHHHDVKHDNTKREKIATPTKQHFENNNHNNNNDNDEESSEGDIFVNKTQIEEPFDTQICVAQCCLIWLAVPGALTLGLTVYFLASHETLSAAVSGVVLAVFGALCLISIVVLIVFKETTKSANARSDARKAEFEARYRNDRSHVQFFEKRFRLSTGKTPQYTPIKLDSRRRALAPYERNQIVQTQFGNATVVGKGPIYCDESLREAHYDTRVFVTYQNDHHNGVPVVYEHSIV